VGCARVVLVCFNSFASSKGFNFQFASSKEQGGICGQTTILMATLLSALALLVLHDCELSKWYVPVTPRAVVLTMLSNQERMGCVL
jgi:hypothetical protein